jgi:3-hydroxybutyryl-CoA dehydrogenase
MNVATVGITGAGQMGAGIAQVFAQAGCAVIVHDPFASSLDTAQQTVRRSLQKLAEKGRLEGAADEIFGRMAWTSRLTDFAAADFVVEAAPENVALKQELFTQLDTITKPHVVLASNTSSIAIGRLAESTQRASQVIGMHFMNPVPLMPCVEVIRGEATHETTFGIVRDLVKRLGKTMVVSQDRAGFIVNRILMPMINEAAYALHEGLATRDDIDTAMKLSCNFPMGPLTLADFIGLDTVVSILEVMNDGLPGKHYAPCPILQDYVAKGWTGRKSGRGFYAY